LAFVLLNEETCGSDSFKERTTKKKGKVKMKSLISTLLMALAFAAQAHADDIKLGEPVYGGSGCPAGSASVTLTDDRKALSVLFDQYMVQAGDGVSLDRKSCNLAIPVHVPQGYSISIYEVDYRGFASVPRGGMAQFNVEYFFAGSSGPRTRQYFQGPRDRDFLISHRLGVEAVVWSRCGEDVILRVNSNILARTNRSQDPAFVSVDSADVNSALVYHVAWKRCR
jgi:hypothetical protein